MPFLNTGDAPTPLCAAYAHCRLPSLRPIEYTLPSRPPNTTASPATTGEDVTAARNDCCHATPNPFFSSAFASTGGAGSELVSGTSRFSRGGGAVSLSTVRSTEELLSSNAARQ